MHYFFPFEVFHIFCIILARNITILILDNGRSVATSSVLATIFTARYWQPLCSAMGSYAITGSAYRALPVSGSENCAQYRSCLHLAANFENKNEK
jgi:hypothetical protein